MSGQELERIRVLGQVVHGGLRRSQAARLLGLSYMTSIPIHRLRERRALRGLNAYQIPKLRTPKADNSV